MVASFTEMRPGLDALAAALVERESLTGEEALAAVQSALGPEQLARLRGRASVTEIPKSVVDAVHDRVDQGAALTTVGFLGGTGPTGRGLGLRLALAGHDVLLGSRDASRAQQAADALPAGGIRGVDNAEACAGSDVVVVATPYEGLRAVVGPLAGALAGKPLVCTVVPMEFDERGPRPLHVDEGSAAEQCAALAPQARVVAGFQWVPTRRLLRPDVVVEMDVPLCADDTDAAAAVAELAGDVKDLRGFHAGPLRLARSLEGLTPLLVSTNQRYKAHTGVRFVGLDLPDPT